MALRPQLLAGIGLLALIPVVVFLLNRGETIVALSIVNVFIIVGSIYTMFSPIENEEHGHSAA